MPPEVGTKGIKTNAASHRTVSDIVGDAIRATEEGRDVRPLLIASIAEVEQTITLATIHDKTYGQRLAFRLAWLGQAAEVLTHATPVEIIAAPRPVTGEQIVVLGRDGCNLERPATWSAPVQDAFGL